MVKITTDYLTIKLESFLDKHKRAKFKNLQVGIVFNVFPECNDETKWVPSAALSSTAKKYATCLRQQSKEQILQLHKKWIKDLPADYEYLAIMSEKPAYSCWAALPYSPSITDVKSTAVPPSKPIVKRKPEAKNATSRAITFSKKRGAIAPQKKEKRDWSTFTEIWTKYNGSLTEIAAHFKCSYSSARYHAIKLDLFKL